MGKTDEGPLLKDIPLRDAIALSIIASGNWNIYRHGDGKLAMDATFGEVYRMVDALMQLRAESKYPPVNQPEQEPEQND